MATFIAEDTSWSSVTGATLFKPPRYKGARWFPLGASAATGDFRRGGICLVATGEERPGGSEGDGLGPGVASGVAAAGR